MILIFFFQLQIFVIFLNQRMHLKNHQHIFLFQLLNQTLHIRYGKAHKSLGSIIPERRDICCNPGIHLQSLPAPYIMVKGRYLLKIFLIHAPGISSSDHPVVPQSALINKMLFHQGRRYKK